MGGKHFQQKLKQPFLLLIITTAVSQFDKQKIRLAPPKFATNLEGVVLPWGHCLFNWGAIRILGILLRLLWFILKYTL